MSYSKLSILKPGQTFSIGDAVFILLEHGKVRAGRKKFYANG